MGGIVVEREARYSHERNSSCSIGRIAAEELYNGAFGCFFLFLSLFFFSFLFVLWFPPPSPSSLNWRGEKSSKPPSTYWSRRIVKTPGIYGSRTGSLVRGNEGRGFLFSP